VEPFPTGFETFLLLNYGCYCRAIGCGTVGVREGVACVGIFEMDLYLVQLLQFRHLMLCVNYFLEARVARPVNRTGDPRSETDWRRKERRCTDLMFESF
jgi:hypothetical protein